MFNLFFFKKQQQKLLGTSSSFILISFSVSTSGVDSGRMGIGLSIRLSWASLLGDEENGEKTSASIEVVCYTFARAHAFIPHVPGHLLYALRSVVFIVDVAGYVFEVVHVGTNQHVPQFHKVTVRLVFHCAKKYASLTLLIQSRHANYFNLHSGWIKLNRRGIFECAYLRRSPRGTAFPSLFVHELPPLCYCQSQRTGCTPAEGDARKGCYFNPSLLRESCLSMLVHTGSYTRSQKTPELLKTTVTLFVETGKRLLAVYFLSTDFLSWSVRSCSKPASISPEPLLYFHLKGQ